MGNLKTGRRLGTGSAVHSEICDFLIDEAWMLDDGRLEEWLALMADDVVYFMPTRMTVQVEDGLGFDDLMGHFDDDRASLALRVRRIVATKSALTERPPGRTRRIVGNVQVWETEVENEYSVRSGCVILRNRLDRPTYDILSASRNDLVRRSSDRLLIARRHILVDQSTLGSANLSFFF